MKDYILNLFKGSLFQNSFYPMLGTGIMAGFGFLFWLLSARLFSTADTGLAAALITVMTMVSTLSLLGFDTATVRFLAHEKRKNESMNTGIVIVALAAFLLTGLFVLFVDMISPKLSFVAANVSTALAFVVFTVMAAVNMFTDSIFLAFRQTKFTLIINTIFSVVKVALPLLFVPWGALGIFVAAALAQSLGFFMSIGVLMYRFGYRPHLRIDSDVIRRFWRYSAGNYTADSLGLIPMTVLPIIIANHLGAEQVAYYFIVMMIVGLLYVIPMSTMRSLFAESSHDETKMLSNIRGSLETTALILVPSVIVLLLAGKYILLLFGTDYSTSGLSYLYIMTLVSILVTMFSLFGSLFRLTHNIHGLIVRNLVYAGSTMGLVYILLPFGLVGIGAAYAGGNLIGTLVSYVLFQRHMNVTNHELASRLTVGHVLNSMYGYFNEQVVWPFKTLITCKLAYVHARAARGTKRTTILCYPEKPRTYHTLYKLCHRLGWKMTTNPRSPADIYMHFEDVTQREENAVVKKLQQSDRVLNAHCRDISKTRVAKVFEEVFGYPLSLDPRTHTGVCVRKSDTNAVHDGTIVDCPTEPEEGYVYSKLIDTTCDGDRAYDLRIPICNTDIAFVLKRYKSHDDLFDKTIDAEMLSTEDVLNSDEIKKVLLFAKRMGLDYGELDALRDCTDGRLYIVDVNNTPSGPIGPLYGNKRELDTWFTLLSHSMKKEFLAR